jgi:hypothetical protein
LTGDWEQRGFRGRRDVIDSTSYESFSKSFDNIFKAARFLIFNHAKKSRIFRTLAKVGDTCMTCPI